MTGTCCSVLFGSMGTPHLLIWNREAARKQRYSTIDLGSVYCMLNKSEEKFLGKDWIWTKNCATMATLIIKFVLLRVQTRTDTINKNGLNMEKPSLDQGMD